MTRIWFIAHREWMENTRQPAMIASMASLLVLFDGFILGVLTLLDMTAQTASGAERLNYRMGLFGLPMEDALGTLTQVCVFSLNFLAVSQLLGMTAVLAGHAAIHDRLSGTLPFLLLAPVRRVELMAGKVIGALSVPLAVYLLIGGASALVAWSFPVTADLAASLPASPSWWVGFLFAGPAWALTIGALCVIVSSSARDVRTAQQIAWFLVFFATLILVPVLVPGPGSTALGMTITAVSGVAVLLLMLVAGARWLSRDLGR